MNAFHKDNFGSTPLDWLNSYCQLTDDVKEAVQEQFQEGTFFFIWSQILSILIVSKTQAKSPTKRSLENIVANLQNKAEVKEEIKVELLEDDSDVENNPSILNCNLQEGVKINLNNFYV